MKYTLMRSAPFILGAALVLTGFGGGGAGTARAATSTAPVISSVNASSTGSTTATVTWQTDVPATSQVAYGTTTPYSTFSALFASTTTAHSVTLSALLPNTLYHFQVISSALASNTASSSDRTFMTAGAGTGTSTGTSTTTTTPAKAPVISAIHAAASTTSATVTWTTDQAANSQLFYGTTASYGSTTPLESALVTGHSQNILNLSPSTTYHFQVRSANGSSTLATSSDQLFTTAAFSSTTGTTTTPGGGTGTTTSSDIQNLQNQINQIWAAIHALQQQVAQLTGTTGTTTPNGGGTGTTTLPVSGTATIDQNGQTVRVGGGIDFGGHNFGSEEHVSVMLNGQQVGTAFTNQGGGFSTGSMSVPGTPGTYTYSFVGQNSGITATATITVQ